MNDKNQSAELSHMEQNTRSDTLHIKSENDKDMHVKVEVCENARIKVENEEILNLKIKEEQNVCVKVEKEQNMIKKEVQVKEATLYHFENVNIKTEESIIKEVSLQKERNKFIFYFLVETCIMCL